VLGNFLTSVLAFIFAFIMLVTLGIGAPLPIAFMYAIFDIISDCGRDAGRDNACGHRADKSVTAAVIMTVAILEYQQVESSVFAPRVYGKALRLPNVVVMLAAILAGC
jgi:predicted PurR-regulated permease PerM